MKHRQEIITYDSPDAASLRTVTGWVDRHGRFWGIDEHMARWSGSTHRLCEKNPEHGLYETRSWCSKCHHERRQTKFADMPRAEWDGTTPLVIFDTDHFFFDEDSLRDWLHEEGVDPEDAQLVICKPNRAREIEADHFGDDLPDEGELPSELESALEALNAEIRKAPPLSWSEGDVAAILPSGFIWNK